MNKPKFKAGDVVDVRGKIKQASGLVIKADFYHRGGEMMSRNLESLGEQPEGWYYGFHGTGSGAHEKYVFPHNRPGDSFDEIMRELGKPVKDLQPV